MIKKLDEKTTYTKDVPYHIGTRAGIENNEHKLIAKINELIDKVNQLNK